MIFVGNATALALMRHPNMLINGPAGRVVTPEMFLNSVRSGANARERCERNPKAVRITGNIGVLLGHEIVVAAGERASTDRFVHGAADRNRPSQC